MSHSVLALLSVMMFTSVLVAVTITSMYSIDQASRSPLLKVYGEAFVDPETGVTTIIINVKHEYGRPVRLLYVDLVELGRIYAQNFRESNCNELIKPGELCKFKYTLKGALNTKRTYTGVAVFSEGVYPVAFTPLYIYKPARNDKPPYNTTFTGITLTYSNVTGYSLIANTSYLTDEGAQLRQNGTGVIVIDSETYRYFGGMGFVYNNATNLEVNLTSGTWLIALLRLVNYTANRLPLKWGFGIYFDHKQPDQPQELIAFIGISVNSSSTAHFVIERYDRDKGLVEVVASTPIKTSLENLFKDLLIIAARIETDRNLNFFRVNVTLYDSMLTVLASLNSSFTVKLPGTPGAEWYLRPALVVCNVATYYEDFRSAEQLTLPLIIVSGIPENYVLEVHISGTLVFKTTSRGNPIVLPFTWLPSGSTLVVKYPVDVGELLAYRYVTPTNIGPFTEIVLNATTVNTTTQGDRGSAVISVKLPIGDNTTNITGALATIVVNRNNYVVQLRLTLRPEHSVIGDITLIVDIVDIHNQSIFSNRINIEKGHVVTNTTGWSRPLEPGETLYLYLLGYYTTPGQTRIVLWLETLVIDHENNRVITIEERPVVLNTENS